MPAAWNTTMTDEGVNLEHEHGHGEGDDVDDNDIANTSRKTGFKGLRKGLSQARVDVLLMCSGLYAPHRPDASARCVRPAEALSVRRP